MGCAQSTEASGMPRPAYAVAATNAKATDTFSLHSRNGTDGPYADGVRSESDGSLAAEPTPQALQLRHTRIVFAARVKYGIDASVPSEPPADDAALLRSSEVVRSNARCRRWVDDVLASGAGHTASAFERRASTLARCDGSSTASGSAYRPTGWATARSATAMAGAQPADSGPASALDLALSLSLFAPETESPMGSPICAPGTGCGTPLARPDFSNTHWSAPKAATPQAGPAALPPPAMADDEDLGADYVLTQEILQLHEREAAAHATPRATPRMCAGAGFADGRRPSQPTTPLQQRTPRMTPPPRNTLRVLSGRS